MNRKKEKAKRTIRYEKNSIYRTTKNSLELFNNLPNAANKLFGEKVIKKTTTK